MCGRSSLTKTEKELEERFNATFYSEDLERYNPLPNYNVAPTHLHPVMTNEDPDHLKFYKWGLIPFWAKDSRIGYKMINARIETVLEKSSFKNALQRRRCIVPFDGFYEWKKTTAGKQPYRIQTTDQEIFTIAGLWEKWKAPDGEYVFTFTLITQDPNQKLKHIHDRMPAILNREQEDLWLSNEIPPGDLIQMIRPYPDELITFYPVSTRVNNVRENDATLIEPISLENKTDGTLF